jgi:N-acetylmuramoyl-L-alanine amidase
MIGLGGLGRGALGAWMIVLAAGAFAGVATAEPPPGSIPQRLQLIPVRGAPRMATAWERDGVLYLSGTDLAVLLDAVQYWRPELGRLTLGLPRHQISVTDGSDVAVVDGDHLIHLPGNAFLWEDRMMLPLDLLVAEDGRPRPWVELPLFFSRERGRLSASKREGVVTGAEIDRVPEGFRLNLTADVPIRYDLTRAERSSVVLRIGGLEYDPLLYPLPTEHEWFQGLRIRNLPDGLEVSFSPGSDAVGYRISTPNDSTLRVLLGSDERDLREGTLRPFATTRNLVPATIRVAALDPGHGGSDPGATIGDKTEAELAYDLCIRVAARLREDLGVEPILTRDENGDPGAAARAGIADRRNADVFLSIHVHDRPGGPAAFVAELDRQAGTVPPELATLGFRSYSAGQVPYIASSRLLARTVVDAVAGRLDESVEGVRAEDLAQLQGATMPAVLLELGMGDGATPWNDDRLDQAAAGIVEGLRLYLLSGEEGR